ncbi:hypothetical protein [Paenibacillus sp. P46E]|uniref:hypothetical protein n=1 Tax=Paenibacillus sp. P46E TaxID=1349436 RepID=UPI00093F6409|nr:hypothetical protein [Paenibacillus sp. P46E]OKP95670.1 hypothetical protein A3849_23925 [Paenibacillus sp. P46E]
MSEELSRVKSRKKPNKAEQPAPVRKRTESRTLSAPPTINDSPAAVAGTLSRKSRHSAVQPGKKIKREARPVDEESSTPSRAESYPSERLRFSKMFINSLIVIFLLLLLFLLYWGLIGAPDLNTLW